MSLDAEWRQTYTRFGTCQRNVFLKALVQRKNHFNLHDHTARRQPRSTHVKGPWSVRAIKEKHVKPDAYFSSIIALLCFRQDGCRSNYNEKTAGSRETNVWEV